MKQLIVCRWFKSSIAIISYISKVALYFPLRVESFQLTQTDNSFPAQPIIQNLLKAKGHPVWRVCLPPLYNGSNHTEKI